MCCSCDFLGNELESEEAMELKPLGKSSAGGCCLSVSLIEHQTCVVLSVCQEPACIHMYDVHCRHVGNVVLVLVDKNVFN